MSAVAGNGRAKVVFVRTYRRFRFGKWEDVISHFRSWPVRQYRFHL